jgi:hypothetical protein
MAFDSSSRGGPIRSLTMLWCKMSFFIQASSTTAASFTSPEHPNTGHSPRRCHKWHSPQSSRQANFTLLRSVTLNTYDSKYWNMGLEFRQHVSMLWTKYGAIHHKDKLNVYVCISLLDIRIRSHQLLDLHASNVA